uniref:NADH dehydrogenase subunit 2 n=1 Tax=Laeocathaica amdoana TaxID=2936362 RepID=UPI0022FD586E|nr:NADH dehydrogenase subunit 2 [Laeocathaica amdoana]WBF92706.1 NADH dehydrogenase subunit 2 [Laeocathaica amdoana]
MSFMLLILFLNLSLMFGFVVSNWILMVLLMEVTLFTFLFMVFEYNLVAHSSPAIKYFFSQTLGSIMLLLAGLVLMVFLNKGSVLGMYLMLLGMCLKLGVFPMHFWVVPTSMELPYFMLAILGVPMKVLPLILLNNYVDQVVDINFLYIFMVLGCGSMVMGMMLGLGNTYIRGILGASSVTHSGWFFFGVVSKALVSYFLLYSITLLFVLFSLMFMFYWGSAVGLVALAGLPPFGVFLGKLLVLMSFYQINLPVVFLVPALFSSVFSLIYYLKFSFSFLFFTK